MKINLSKTQWEQIGITAGWINQAQETTPLPTGGSFQFKVYENDGIFAEGVESSFELAAESVEDFYFQSLENDARLNNEKKIEGYIYDEASNTTHEFDVQSYSYQEYPGASAQTDYKKVWVSHPDMTIKEFRLLQAEAEADRRAKVARDEYLIKRKDFLNSGLSPEEYRAARLEAEQAEFYDPQAGMEDDFRD